MKFSVQDTLEDLVLGSATMWTIMKANWNVIWTVLLTSIYIIYKIIKEKHQAGKAKMEKELMRIQLDEWKDTKKTIKELEDKVKKQQLKK